MKLHGHLSKHVSILINDKLVPPWISYLPVISYVKGTVAHSQVRSMEVLQDDELPPGLPHGWREPAVPQHVPAGVAVDVAHHSTVDVVRLAQLLLHTHQHSLVGVLVQEVHHAFEDMAEVGPLVGHTMVDGEVTLHVAHADIQEAHTGAELGPKAPGLAFGESSSKQSHGVVGARHGDLREG